MLRVAALCMVVIACGLWGMRRAGRLFGRVEQIKLAIDALRRLQGYMLHWKLQMQDALYKAGHERGLGAVLRQAGVRMAEEVDALPGAVIADALEKAKAAELHELRDDDLNALCEFFSSLSALDTQQADARFGFVIERLHMNLSQAREEQEKKSRLYRSLGWMTGLAVALLLA